MNEQEIFEIAFAIEDANARKEFLDDACGDDEALRQRLEVLLAATDQSTDFLSVPAYELIDQSGPDGVAGSQTDTADPCQLDTQLASDHNQSSGTSGTKLDYLQSSSNPAALGELGHYEIIKQLGQGAFGTVFKAFDSRLARYVAIKVLGPELASQAGFRQRFLREARSAAAVKHPNIVLVYEVEERPIPFIVMELIDGPTLQHYYETGHRFTLPELIKVGQQIAGALAVAHAKELIHRDIKPGNILIDAGAEQFDSAIKVTDFGLARTIDDNSLSRTGLISGTPMYMSPEQTQGEPLDGRADLFSLGSVLYMLATGRTPFEKGSSIEVMRQVARSDPPPIQSINAEIPDWLCDLIAKLQARDRKERFQSATEVEALLTDGSSRLRASLLVEANVLGDPRESRQVQKAATRAPLISSIPNSNLNSFPGRWASWLTIYSIGSSAANVVLLLSLFWLTLWPSSSAKVINEPASDINTGNADVLNSSSQKSNDQTNEALKVIPPTTWAGWPADAPKPARGSFSMEQAQQHQERWAQYMGVPKEFTNSHNIKFVLIPPGEFKMGSSPEEIKQIGSRQRDQDDLRKTPLREGPIHLVTIPQPLYLSVYEITQKQYREVTGFNPARFSSLNVFEPKTYFVNTNNFPVEKVTWNDVVGFCNRLSELEHCESAYKIDGSNVWLGQGSGYRLPAEAEWEYACRAGTATPYWAGQSEKELAQADWYRCEGYTIVTKQVGQLKPNPFGLYDMHGNVEEWTEELFDEKAYSKGEHLRTPKTPPDSASQPNRVRRGGSYLQVANRCRSARRAFEKPNWSADSVGFRLAISVTAAAELLSRPTPGSP